MNGVSFTHVEQPASHLVHHGLERVCEVRGGLGDDDVVNKRRVVRRHHQIGNQAEILIIHARRAWCVHNVIQQYHDKGKILAGTEVGLLVV